MKKSRQYMRQIVKPGFTQRGEPETVRLRRQIKRLEKQRDTALDEVIKSNDKAFDFKTENKAVYDLLLELFMNDVFERHYEVEGSVDQRACEMLYQASCIQRCQGATNECFWYRSVPDPNHALEGSQDWICSSCRED